MRPGLLANFKYYPLNPVTFSHMIEAKFITTNPRLNWSRLSLISAYLSHGLKSKNILGLHLRSSLIADEERESKKFDGCLWYTNVRLFSVAIRLVWFMIRLDCNDNLFLKLFMKYLINQTKNH